MAAKSFVCALALLGVPLASSAQLRPGADTARGPGASVLGSQAAGTLLYALPDDVLDGREHQLEFVVTEGAAETLRERVTFQAKRSARRAVVEVLPLHPQFLASLRGDGSRDHASIAIHLDGDLVEELTPAELSKRSLDLAGQNLTMVGVQATLRSSTLRVATSPAVCVRDCEQAWLARQRICERFPRPNCEEQSDSRLTLCLQVCGCPVAIREVRVVTTYVGDGLPPQRVCLLDGPIPTEGHFYTRRSKVFKKEHYDDVVYCDGTHQIELGRVEYFIERCVERRHDLPLPCLPDGGLEPACR